LDEAQAKVEVIPQVKIDNQSQYSREEKKNLEREEKKKIRRIQEIEAQIAIYEKEIATIDEQLSHESTYSNPEAMKNLSQSRDGVQKSVDTLFLEWETLLSTG